MESEKEKEIFLSYAREIKEMGYKVFVNTKENHTKILYYGWFVNDKDKIAYFHYTPSYGVSFSSMYKSIGSNIGYWMVADIVKEKNLTREKVNHVFEVAPPWAESQEVKDVYTLTATEFFANYRDQISVIQI